MYGSEDRARARRHRNTHRARKRHNVQPCLHGSDLRRGLGLQRTVRGGKGGAGACVNAPITIEATTPRHSTRTRFASSSRSRVLCKGRSSDGCVGVRIGRVHADTGTLTVRGSVITSNRACMAAICDVKSACNAQCGGGGKGGAGANVRAPTTIEATTPRPARNAPGLPRVCGPERSAKMGRGDY